MTIAMLAAPQPSFSCFTKGTSSHMPEESAAKTTPPTHSTRTIVRMKRGIGFLLADGNNNQNQSRDEDQDNNQVAVAEAGHRLFHLLRVCVGCPQCVLRFLR